MPRKLVGEVEKLAAARMLEAGYSQTLIGRVLGVSQPVISRLLRQGRKEGWIKDDRPRFDTERSSKEMMADIERRISPQGLREQLDALARKNGAKAGPRSIRQFPSESRDTTPVAWKSRLGVFGRMTAGYITELLRRSAVCGVAWGETVASIVSGLGALRIRPPWKEQPITFIPLCGEPPGRALGEYSASAAAAQLDKIVNNDETSHSPSLAGVFALIPREFDWKAVQIIRKAFGYLDGYRDIFQRERWIDKIDCVLTSVSADESPLTFGLLDLTRATGGPDRKRLHELVIGDICGIFIPRLGLRSPELAELKEIQKRWNGMTELQLKRCADNALQNGAPGVIVMAIGKNKAAMVYESVKRGLVNTLVIDDDLAEELKHLIAM